MSYSRLVQPGFRFGRWTVEAYTSSGSLCVCDCGNRRVVDNNNLRSGKSKWCLSCGRSNNTNSRRKCKHLSGLVYRRLNTIVQNAVRRCTDPGYHQWDDYGGRGIRVDKDWMEDKYLFIEYLSALPGHDNSCLVLDRRDNESHYMPGNLRFVTRSLSSKNRRNFGYKLGHGSDGRFVKKQGELHCMLTTF